MHYITCNDSYPYLLLFQVCGKYEKKLIEAKELQQKQLEGEANEGFELSRTKSEIELEMAMKHTGGITRL